MKLGKPEAQLVSCDASDTGGAVLRYDELDAKDCPGISRLYDCGFISLVNDYRLTAWVTTGDYIPDPITVLWSEDPGGLMVRFAWAVPKWVVKDNVDRSA